MVRQTIYKLSSGCIFLFLSGKLPPQSFSSSSFQRFYGVILICTGPSTAYCGMSISLHYQSLLHTPAYNYIREKLLTFNIKTEKLFQKTFFSPDSIPPVVLLSLLAMHHHTFFCIATETEGQQVISSVFSLISNISKEVPALLLLTALSL